MLHLWRIVSCSCSLNLRYICFICCKLSPACCDCLGWMETRIDGLGRFRNNYVGVCVCSLSPPVVLLTRVVVVVLLLFHFDPAHYVVDVCACAQCTRTEPCVFFLRPLKCVVSCAVPHCCMSIPSVPTIRIISSFIQFNCSVLVHPSRHCGSHALI